MRLAISGTHCSGKSSLIDAFLDKYPRFTYEVEAYEALEHLNGEAFSAEANAEDLFRQLEYCVERIRFYRTEDQVIFERSPLDYVAYLQALTRLKRGTASASLTEIAIETAKSAITELDAIAYLPLNECEIEVSDEEDLQLRKAVDRRLEALLIEDELNVLNNSRPMVIELHGSIANRLLTLNSKNWF